MWSQLAAQRCCEAGHECVCVCVWDRQIELVGDGGLQYGDGDKYWDHWYCLSCQNKDCLKWMRPAATHLLNFTFMCSKMSPFLFSVFLFAQGCKRTWYSVRLSYSTQHFILWQWLNGMNGRSIAQFSDLDCTLLSLCGTKRSKLWNMRHMWDLFSGITKLPLKNG